MHIFVKLLTVRTLNLDVKPENTVKDIKNMIHDKEGFPPDKQKLKFGRIDLSDDHTLSSYKIDDNATINLELVREITMKIIVQISSTKRITLEVRSSDKIEIIKKMIFDKEGIPLDQQQLMFGEFRLKEDFIVSDYNIQNESILKLLLQTQDDNKIYVKSLMDNVYALEAKPSDTVESVHTKIQVEEGIPSELQKLTYDLQELKIGHTLSQYNVQKNSTLKLGLKDGVFQIFVKSLEGKTISTHVKSTSTVECIMDQVMFKSAIPKSAQRLIFGGKQLEMNQTIEDCAIPINGTIHIVIRLKGGI